MQVKLLLIRASIILIIFTQFSCYKEYDLVNQEYYFLRGMFLVGQPPLFRLYKCNTKTNELEIPFNTYNLEVVDENGNVAKMSSSGAFSFFVCKPNTTYTIRWKMQNENEWHTFTKETIVEENDLINNINVQSDKELYLNRPINQNITYFLANNLNPQSIYFFKSYYFVDSYSIDLPQSFLELNQSSNALTLWPPRKKDEYPRHQRFVDFCFKPFTWEMYNGPIFKDFELFAMSKLDFEYYYNMYKNDNTKTKPLAIGESVLYDYRKENVMAKITNIISYPKIRLFDYVKEEDKLHIDIKFNGNTLDTFKYKISNISFDFGNRSKRHPVIRFNNDSAYIGCKDYIAHHYNTAFKMPCGYYASEYKIKILISYIDVVTRKSFIFYDPNVYTYTNGGRIIINIQ